MFRQLLSVVLASGMLAAAGWASAADRFAPGYLTKDTAPDTSQIVPPPPTDDDAAQRWDWDVFLATRKLQDTRRWDLAKVDVDYSVTALATDFSCAVGARLDEATAPATLSLMARARSDAAIGSSRAKGQYRRERPFVGNFQPICTPRDPELIASPSYPSGHSTLGWTLGLVLSELVPERTTAILTRARAFGESRVVCGVHFASDVEAGRTAGASVFAALNGMSEFQADVAKAREELARLRANPDAAPYPGQCSNEAELAKRPW